jgi:hypothetical protein
MPRAGQPRSRGCILAMIKRLRFVQDIRTGSESQTGCYSMAPGGGQGLFPFVNGIWVVKLTSHLHLLPRLGMRGVILLFLRISS